MARRPQYRACGGRAGRNMAWKPHGGEGILIGTTVQARAGHKSKEAAYAASLLVRAGPEPVRSTREAGFAESDYFAALPSLLPNFWRNFSTRPAVSMIFWVPV